MYSYYFEYLVGTGIITAALITSSLSIPAFTSSWALPIGVVLSSMQLLALANASFRKSSYFFAVKQERNNSDKVE